MVYFELRPWRPDLFDADSANDDRQQLARSAQPGEIVQPGLREPIREQQTRKSMFQRRSLVVSISLVAVVLSTALGRTDTGAGSAPPRSCRTGPSKDPALTGTDQIGQATWRAENGEIVGTPTSADGGWLLINPGLPGRAGRRFLPVRCGVYRRRHAAGREERVGDQRHLHDAGRWTAGASRRDGRRAGAHRQSRAVDALRRCHAANPAAPSTAECRPCRRCAGRRPRGRSGPGLRVDVSAARLDGIQAK